MIAEVIPRRFFIIALVHNVENILSHLHCVNNQPLYGLRTRCGERSVNQLTGTFRVTSPDFFINLLNNEQMKQSKIMLAVIATILLTWCVMGMIGYLLSDLSYKECMTHGGTLMSMMIFGWIPSVILGADLDKSIE